MSFGEGTVGEQPSEERSTQFYPEVMDPSWFQDYVRRAFERHQHALMRFGVERDEAWERAMWYVFTLRDDPTALYEAGRDEAETED
jgi:hypothetical protein